MNWNQALFPSLKRRGGCAIKKMPRSNLSSRRRGGQIGEIFRPEEFRRTDHPVCGASEASRLTCGEIASLVPGLIAIAVVYDVAIHRCIWPIVVIHHVGQR